MVYQLKLNLAMSFSAYVKKHDVPKKPKKKPKTMMRGADSTKIGVEFKRE